MSRPTISWLRDVVFPIGNFSVFVGLLFYFLRNPGKVMFRSRSQELSKAIAEATTAFNTAKQNFTEAKKRLDTIEIEKGALLKSAKEEIESLKEKSRMALSGLLESIKSENEQKVKESAIKAQRQLKMTIAKKIILATEDLLRKELKEKDFRRLNDEYLETPLYWVNSSEGKSYESKKRGTIRESAQ